MSNHQVFHLLLLVQSLQFIEIWQSPTFETRFFLSPSAKLCANCCNLEVFYRDFTIRWHGPWPCQDIMSRVFQELEIVEPPIHCDVGIVQDWSWWILLRCKLIVLVKSRS